MMKVAISAVSVVLVSLISGAMIPVCTSDSHVVGAVQQGEDPFASTNVSLEVEADPFGGDGSSDRSEDPFAAAESKHAVELVNTRPKVVYADRRADERIRSALNRSMDLVSDAEPFGDIRQMLEDALKINIVIDVNLDGILDDDTEVSANLTGIRLGDSLRTMLRAVDATYVVHDGVLLIISIDDEGEPEYLALQMIDVKELLQLLEENEPDRMGKCISKFGNFVVGGFGPDPFETKNEDEAAKTALAARTFRPIVTPEYMLVSATTSLICPDSWEENGSGNGVIRCVGGVLVFRASEKVGDEIHEFVERLTAQLKKRLE